MAKVGGPGELYRQFAGPAALLDPAGAGRCARVALLAKALSIDKVGHQKTRPSGAVFSDASPTGIATTCRGETRVAPTPDDSIIFIPEVRTGLVAMSQQPGQLFMDNQAALANLKRGKLYLKLSVS